MTFDIAAIALIFHITKADILGAWLLHMLFEIIPARLLLQ